MWQVDAVGSSKNVVEIEVFYYCDYSTTNWRNAAGTFLPHLYASTLQRAFLSFSHLPRDIGSP